VIPEKTDSLIEKNANTQQGVNNSAINLEELAEYIVRLLKDELEREGQRLGVINKGR
jgi:hypothetical protein